PDPSVAFALSRLDEPAFAHVPIGVFRSVDRPSYDQLLNEQIDTAVAAKGQGSLAELLHSGDTWTINCHDRRRPTPRPRPTPPSLVTSARLGGVACPGP